MAYRIPLPEGGRSTSLDIVEPNTTAVQRFIRREGLGAYEPPTAAAMLSLCAMLDPGFVVYDVGANMGLYGQLAASMFSPSIVHSFEPARSAIARLGGWICRCARPSCRSCSGARNVMKVSNGDSA
jgi:hypothetical protein